MRLRCFVLRLREFLTDGLTVVLQRQPAGVEHAGSKFDLRISHTAFKRTEREGIGINHDKIFCLPWLIGGQGCSFDENRRGREKIIARGLRYASVRVFRLFSRNRGVRFACKVAFAMREAHAGPRDLHRNPPELTVPILVSRIVRQFVI